MGKFALKSPHVGARFVGLCPIRWDAVTVYAAEGLRGGFVRRVRNRTVEAETESLGVVSVCWESVSLFVENQRLCSLGIRDSVR